MFFVTKPTDDDVNRFIQTNKESGFSYPFIGETKNHFVRTRKRPGTQSFNVDHHRTIIGHGEDDWRRAKEAIRNWKMFDMPWVELCWPDTLIEVDQTVAVLIHHFGFYSLNAAQIVYVIDKLNCYGFAYGTLSDHGESGEERFLVEMDPETYEIWYDLYAFSKPNHVFARVGYPLARILQKKFAQESKAAMIRAVSANQTDFR